MNPSNGNPEKPGETIFAKYFNGLRETNVRLGGIDEAAVRLAMHLAITDALALREPAPPACHVSNATDQRIAEWQQSQIGRLNEWLEENHPALYHSPSHDTAGAMIHLYEEVSRELIQMKRADAEGHAAMLQLRAELASALADVKALGEELRKAEAMTAEQPGYEEQQNRLMRWLIDNEPEASLACDADKGVAGVIIALLDKQRLSIANYDRALTHAQNEAAMLRQQRASLQEDLDATQQAREDNRQEVQQLRQELTQALQRAAVVDPTPAPDWGPSHPAWQGLTAADLGVIDQLASGATKFRKLTRPARCDLVLRAIRHLASERNGTISGGDWDRYRPLWMPTTGAVMMLSDDGRWPSLLALALETPAASAA